MKRVTGLGGVFFKCKDPQKTRDWYQAHLGIETDAYGGMFEWRQKENPKETGTTSWSPFPEDTAYFDPGQQDFMFNYRVEDLEALLTVLEAEGVKIVGKMEAFDYGKFAWIIDLDGNKVELWEPVDQPLVDFKEQEKT